MKFLLILIIFPVIVSAQNFYPHSEGDRLLFLLDEYTLTQNYTYHDYSYLQKHLIYVKEYNGKQYLQQWGEYYYYDNEANVLHMYPNDSLDFNLPNNSVINFKYLVEADFTMKTKQSNASQWYGMRVYKNLFYMTPDPWQYYTYYVDFTDGIGVTYINDSYADYSIYSGGGNIYSLVQMKVDDVVKPASLVSLEPKTFYYDPIRIGLDEEIEFEFVLKPVVWEPLLNKIWADVFIKKSTGDSTVIETCSFDLVNLRLTIELPEPENMFPGDTLFFRVGMRELSLTDTTFYYPNGYYKSIPIIAGPTSLDNDQQSDLGYKLFQNYPNPFNPVTRIKFELKTSSFIRLQVFNIRGEKVATLCEKNLSRGVHSVEFDGHNLSSGIYFTKLQVFDNNGMELTSLGRKMVLIK
ncbi:MAG: hypothetical protein SCALA702_04580 [Melioribacteraceae bacterium]|nr:MAG: hypothetical protein SCALA702_04580 [Melioribacteraceae bacterium]